MKIGILTFQETNNYGAIWQNYALQQALLHLGAQVETIDYQSPYTAKPYRFRHLFQKGAAGYLFGLAGYVIYLFRTKGNARFRKRISYSRPVTSMELAGLNGVYDQFLTGSDQVWNGRLTGYDDAYFLSFVKDSNQKASYAASMGAGEISDRDRAWYRRMLLDYPWISVREKSAGEALQNLLHTKVYTVMDPVFLLSAGHWKQVAGERRLVKENYILVYQLGISGKFTAYAGRCAKRYRCRLVFLPFPLIGPVRGYYKITAGAGEALNYIRYAEYVITDSFHGTAFSIIFQKQFTTLADGTHSGVNARIRDLLHTLGLQEQIWKDQTELDQKIDWDSVGRRLEAGRRKSYEYLKKITEGAGHVADQDT